MRRAPPSAKKAAHTKFSPHSPTKTSLLINPKTSIFLEFIYILAILSITGHFALPLNNLSQPFGHAVHLFVDEMPRNMSPSFQNQSFGRDIFISLSRSLDTESLNSLGSMMCCKSEELGRRIYLDSMWWKKSEKERKRSEGWLSMMRHIKAKQNLIILLQNWRF